MVSRGLQVVVKRILDATLAGTGLVAVAPVLGVVAVAIRATMGRPVLFRQERAGYLGKPFILYKFRTMLDPSDPRARGPSDEDRLTRLGAFLRSTSLDELPSLWNVVRGDMSLVGPRPLLMRYLPRYSPEQARRHEVRPGVTGWAQVNGRNALTWPEKFALDVWYVDHWNLWLDLKILAMTVVKVFRREGISAGGYATMPEFMGNEPDVADPEAGGSGQVGSTEDLCGTS